MPVPKFKLSLLQSRFMASITASMTLLMLYFVFSNAHFAYAADVPSIQAEDHSHDRLLATPFLDADEEGLDLRDIGGYRDTLLGYGNEFIGRAPQAATSADTEVLINNRPITDNVVQGETNQYSFLKASVFGTLSPATYTFPSALGLRDIHANLVEDDVDIEEAWPGGTKAADVELKRRQTTGDSRTVYISVNTCVQPAPVQNTTTDPPPQLKLYISQSHNNTTPGPTKSSNAQEIYSLVSGAIMVQINATDDVFLGVYGEQTTDYKDVWSSQIAVSIDGFYHTFHNGSYANLTIVDTDSSASLLLTSPLAEANQSSSLYEAWMKAPSPYVLFASKVGDQLINGLQNSYCGLAMNAAIRPVINSTVSVNVDRSITNLTWDGLNYPKQQFYVTDLSPSSTYNVFLGMYGNSTDSGDFAGGGGQIWPAQNITTLTNNNCAIISGLSFCSNTAYAVPSNPKYNVSELAAFYDNYTQTQFGYFEKALAQISCETTSSARYSLARNCSDCTDAYKDWVCAVTIPRCTDWAPALSSAPWLQERNLVQEFPNSTILWDYDLYKATNDSSLLAPKQSRRVDIDTDIAPGPYNEVLPCDDLCLHIVQSCPAAFGFSCPRPGDTGFNQSYGVTSEKTNMEGCNYPGNQGEGSWGHRSEVSSLVLVTLAVMHWML
ncbi:stretch-activated Ca2+-permeable channel component-domain-containing protein [Calycina marina]|uniref:Stretch-activated Ca2+-permeable channel component-domain-containing protein n=1 Tax=Calycina marina TaxID=1763456 RepID=A0A9P7ZCJ7_9HELO|nr:stretch-activated Ca2+-permeable channel component-domain-containing protein [Calycina marina]